MPSDKALNRTSPNLIAAGMIPAGDVDDRSITEVQADDLKGYTQCHFFAGIGGWSYALQLANWPTDRPVWTGSCPCQPFSTAGEQKGRADERHLWPIWFDFIRSVRPPVVMGEQVAAAIGHGWLDGVYSDMEGAGYACGATIIPACAVNAPHRRDRLWFVADTTDTGFSHRRGTQMVRPASFKKLERRGGSIALGVAQSERSGWRQNDQDERRRQQPSSDTGQGVGHRANSHENGCDTSPIGEFHNKEHNAESCCSMGHTFDQRPQGHTRNGDNGDQSGRLGSEPSRSTPETGFWNNTEWITGADGKARRVEPSIPLLADGVPARVAKLRAIGNAIVPQVAAEVIAAYMETRDV